jgi:hypothetical protein
MGLESPAADAWALTIAGVSVTSELNRSLGHAFMSALFAGRKCRVIVACDA